VARGAWGAVAIAASRGNPARLLGLNFLRQNVEFCSTCIGRHRRQFCFLRGEGRIWDVFSQVAARRCPGGRQRKQIVADKKIYCLALVQLVFASRRVPKQDVAALSL
jgi:hypothetical protein